MSGQQLKNAIQFLRKSGFLSAKNVVHSSHYDQLSTFGLLFKSNLLEILNQLDRHSLLPVFPVNQLHHLDDALMEQLLLSNSFKSNQSDGVKTQLKSFALRTDTQMAVNQSIIDLNNDLNWKCQHEQSLAIYCSHSNALNTFHWTQSNRYRLWRSMSQFPANFHLKELRSDNSAVQQLCIEFRKSDLVIPLETISYHQPETNDGHAEHNVNLKNCHIVKCDTYVDNCAIALLFDALIDKPNRTVMMLNEKLVPYQIAVAMIGSVDERMSEIVDYLYSLTKHLNISVYPFLYQIDSLDAQFDSLDKIGVLYTVIIDSSTTSKGIIHLRNRDTQLMEQQHISKIQDYLPLYTKNRRPHEIVENKKNVDTN